MGIFKNRRKKDEAFKIQLEREAMERMNHDDDDGFTLPFEYSDSALEWNISGRTKAPNVITPEELLGKSQAKKENNAPHPSDEWTGEEENIPMSREESTISSSDFLFQRMTDSRKQSLEQNVIQKPPAAESTANAADAPESEKEAVADKQKTAPVRTDAADVSAAKLDSLPQTEAAQTAAPKTEPQKEAPFDLTAAIQSLKNDARSYRASDTAEKTPEPAVPGSDNANQKATIEKQPAADTAPADRAVSNRSQMVKPAPESSKKSDRSAENMQKQAPVPPQSKSSGTGVAANGKPQTNPAPAAPAAKPESAAERRIALLARCNAFLQDDELGAVPINTEKYKLESVESILKDFEARASQRVTRAFQTGSPVSETGSRFSAAGGSDSGKSQQTDSASTLTDIISQSTAGTPTSALPDANSTEDQGEVRHYFTTSPSGIGTGDAPNEDLSATRVVPKTVNIPMTSEPSTTRATQVFPAASISAAAHKKDDLPDETEAAAPAIEASQSANASNLKEYKTTADRERVLQSLQACKKRLSVRLILNFLLLIPAILLLTPVADWVKGLGTNAYYICNLIISILVICFNLNIMRGLGRLFSSTADPDLPVALASVGVLVHSIVLLAMQSTALPLTAVLLLSVCFSTLAKRGTYSRIIRNFTQIADASDKRAISIVPNKAVTRAMTGDAIEGGAMVCCGVYTTNLDDFLKYSFSADPVAKKIHSLSLVGAVLAIVLCIITAILNTGNIPFAVTVFAAILCIAASPAALLITQLPLGAAAKHLHRFDAMLTGYRAVYELDHCNAIAVDCKELFPEGSIRLIDMRLLSPNPIDQSILDAAALAEAIGSPIAGIFRQVNNTVRTRTLKVDSAVYEDKMGISGWVDNRRVFIGNRILMEAHGFTSLPPIELDKKIMRKGYFPVYLVSNNVPCAMFIVTYMPDEEITYELRRLCNTGTTVLVHNCDPNISARMLCDYFGVYEETVAVMSKQGSEQYRTLTEQRERVSAGAACKDSVCGLLSTLTAAIHTKSLIASMTVLYVILVVMGFAALAAFAFTPLAAQISALPLLIYQLISTIIICLPPFLRRP